MKARALVCRQQRGVALALVMWFVAGMSLLVAGIVLDARTDTRLAQVHLAAAKVSAAGDGAIALALFDARQAAQKQSAPSDGSYRYTIGDLQVEVSLQPKPGLVDLNTASRELLAALLVNKAGLDAASAAEIATNVVEWRAARGSGRFYNGGARGLGTVEDLLRVPGLSRSLLDALRNYVAVGGQNRVRVGIDWVLAPESLLAVAQLADPNAMAGILRRRDEQRASGSNASRRPVSGSYRADALIRYGEQQWLRRQWVNLGRSGGAGLPWQVQRTEQARMMAPSTEKY